MVTVRQAADGDRRCAHLEGGVALAHSIEHEGQHDDWVDGDEEGDACGAW